MISFSDDINLINVAANCQNDKVLFNDSKIWLRIRRAKFSEIFPKLNFPNFLKTEAPPNPDIPGQ